MQKASQLLLGIGVAGLNLEQGVLALEGDSG